MIKKYASAQLLFTEAKALGLNPNWETPHGLFSFQQNGKDYFVFYTKLYMNSQLGSWMSQDKYLTHTLLQKYNLPHIPFCYTTQVSEVNKFFATHHSIIQKPVLGQKAENTYLINAREEIRKGSLDEWLFEKYISGIEYRCLILQGKVIAMQERRLAPTTQYPWRKIFRNLEKKEWHNEMSALSLRISQLFHMGFMAVDFILDEENKVWVLEVNSVPGLYSFHHPDEGKTVNVAKEVLVAISTE